MAGSFTSVLILHSIKCLSSYSLCSLPWLIISHRLLFTKFIWYFLKPQNLGQHSFNSFSVCTVDFIRACPIKHLKDQIPYNLPRIFSHQYVFKMLKVLVYSKMTNLFFIINACLVFWYKTSYPTFVWLSYIPREQCYFNTEVNNDYNTTINQIFQYNTYVFTPWRFGEDPGIL